MTYKRILRTSAPDALRQALAEYEDVEVRATRGSLHVDDEYAIEGPDGRKAVIDKAVDLFAAEDD